mgnify:CR=1 FL=1
MCDLTVLGLTASPKTQSVLDEICSGSCHVSLIALQIKSLDALKLACQRLGLEFRENQATYTWYGYFAGDAPLPEGFTQEDLGKCQHAIHVPDASYEIGVVFRDGVYKLLWDSWGAGGLEAALGKDCNKLRQAYGVEAAKLEAQRQGYSVWETAEENGAVKLHITVGG